MKGNWISAITDQGWLFLLSAKWWESSGLEFSESPLTHRTNDNFLNGLRFEFSLHFSHLITLSKIAWTSLFWGTIHFIDFSFYVKISCEVRELAKESLKLRFSVVKSALYCVLSPIVYLHFIIFVELFDYLRFFGNFPNPTIEKSFCRSRKK